MTLKKLVSLLLLNEVKKVNLSMVEYAMPMEFSMGNESFFSMMGKFKHDYIYKYYFVIRRLRFCYMLIELTF
jgi:hypothetical protein